MACFEAMILEAILLQLSVRSGLLLDSGVVVLVAFGAAGSGAKLLLFSIYLLVFVRVLLVILR